MPLFKSRKLSWHGQARPTNAGHADGGSREGSDQKSLRRTGGDEAGQGVRSSRPAAVFGGKSEVGIGQFRNKARVGNAVGRDDCAMTDTPATVDCRRFGVLLAKGRTVGVGGVANARKAGDVRMVRGT